MTEVDDSGPTKRHTPAAGTTQDPATAVGQIQVSPAAAAHVLPNGFRLDEFEVQAKLGEGGFSVVYRVWDHSLACVRALKEYMPANVALRGVGSTVIARSEEHKEAFDAGLERFVGEARTLAGFDHPALVRVDRHWEANGTAYMLMPLYEGRTLKAHVRGIQHALSEAWLLSVLDALTQALEVVHAAHWLHRDIAPDNIILVDEGRPVLIDFGAARHVIGGLTQDLTAILKPGYAPIEQYGNTPGMEQGPWTDVYALAATVHWSIVGRPPPSSVTRVLVDGYVPLEQYAAGRFTPRVLGALDRALKVSPKQRTQSVAQLRADLGLGQRSAAQLAPTTATSWASAATAPIGARPMVPSATTPMAPVAPVAPSAAALTANPKRHLAVFAATALLGMAIGAWWLGRQPVGITDEASVASPGATSSGPAASAAGPAASAAATVPTPEATTVATVASLTSGPLNACGQFALVLARRGSSSFSVESDILNWQRLAQKGVRVNP